MENGCINSRCKQKVISIVTFNITVITVVKKKIDTTDDSAHSPKPPLWLRSDLSASGTPGNEGTQEE